MQRDRDIAGYFRYSRLQLFFETDYGDLGAATSDVFERTQKECVAITLALVNRIIDVYRFVTKEDHVQRLGSVHISNLYFPRENLGVYGAALGHGIRSAIMNRSRREIDQLAALLATNDDIPLPELLFLDAEAALQSGRTVLTVVHAFQALELFLAGFLETRLGELGLDPTAVAERLDRHWRTKERLREVLREATGHALTENAPLWDEFCAVYDRIRNRLIHAAREIDREKAERCLRTCRQVITWISEL